MTSLSLLIHAKNTFIDLSRFSSGCVTLERNWLQTSVPFSRERERNVLFNDALNSFYLRLYGFRHMVKDDSDSEKGTRCRHIGYSSINSKGSFISQDNTYHGLCYTSRGALTGTRNRSMGPPHEGSIRRPIAP